MFDIGWTEMLVIAVVMIVVVGPKDLPKMLRTFGQTTKKLRGMAGDFQKQFNEALKEAELDDVKKSVDALRDLNPATAIKKQLNPFEKAAADVRSGLDSTMKPKPAESPVSAEPLKSGATAVPGAAVSAQAAPAKASTFPVMADPAIAKSTRPVAAKSAKTTTPKPAARPASAKAATPKPVAAKPAAKPVVAKAAASPSKAAQPKKKPAGPAK